MIERPETLGVGDSVELPAPYAGTYVVVGTSTYTVVQEPDEDWSEVILQGPEGEVYVSYDGSVVAVSRTVSDDALRGSGLESLTFDGVERAPLSVRLGAVEYTTSEDERDYRVQCTELRSGAEPDRYTAYITDYASAAGAELSIELWDGGRSVTLTE